MNASRSPDSSSAPDASDAAVELRAQIRKCVHDLRNVLASQSSAIHLLGSGLPASALAPELAKQANQLQVAIDQLARLAETATGNDAMPMGSLNRFDNPNTNRARQRVLVVDDNVDAALTLARLLEFEGFEVATAHDGRQAVQQAQTSHPDIVVLDIEMPIMDGYEAAHRIREESQLHHCKLIAVSGHSDAEHRERALAAGFHAHVTKPVDPETLVRLF